MPAPDDTRLQVNFKTPGGTLINVYATGLADLQNYLDQLNNIAGNIAHSEALLNGASNAGPLTVPQQPVPAAFQPQTQGPPPDFAQPPAQAQQPNVVQFPQQQQPAGHPRDKVGRGGHPRPAGPAPSCQHGERFWNSFQARSGKVMDQWLCPLDSGDYRNPAPGQCQVEWAN